MSKFSLKKHFSLDFLGKEWKDAYIDFKTITIGDIRDELPKFRIADEENQEEALQGISNVLEFLKKKFISGKASVDGSLVDLQANDLEELPAEVLSRAISFLSEGVMPDSPAPSGKS